MNLIILSFGFYVAQMGTLSATQVPCEQAVKNGMDLIGQRATVLAFIGYADEAWLGFSRVLQSDKAYQENLREQEALRRGIEPLLFKQRQLSVKLETASNEEKTALRHAINELSDQLAPTRQAIANLETRRLSLVRNLRTEFYAEGGQGRSRWTRWLRENFLMLSEDNQIEILQALARGIESDLADLYMPEISELGTSLQSYRRDLEVKKEENWTESDRKLYNTVIFLETAISEIIGIDYDRAYRNPTGLVRTFDPYVFTP